MNNLWQLFVSDKYFERDEQPYSKSILIWFLFVKYFFFFLRLEKENVEN